MQVHPIVLTGLVCLLTGACANATQGARSGGHGSVITREELDRVPGTSAFDAIQQLRPTWLSRPTAPTARGANPVMVYVDRQQFGTVDDLRHLPTEQVQRMEFLSASDATTRYGTGNSSGVIEVTTKGH